MSNSSLENRRRKAHSPRRTLIRSNSSLLGSIKNFVAAPFTRLFTAPPDDFDDSNDYSGKRRRVVRNVNDVMQEDGPAPAKRMRIRSPDSSPPSAYLDPPNSAFQQKPNYSLSKSPNRSTSNSLSPTTVQDSATVNVRSTVSPLRRQLSQTMTIDPSSKRSLSRDISMQSIPLYDADNRTPQSSLTVRDQSSMPPMTGRPFRMRTSLTPQPSQLQREASEPPTLSSLHSNPVFVRAPSQPLSQIQESQTKPGATTLGSLVGSQRINRPLVRQHSSLLFGTPHSNATPEAATAEKVLRELDFYKTPLVPTRIRSKMSKQFTGASAGSGVTDMFSRKHPLILMGDHDRPRKDRKKERTKEANQTKPYAGTGGIKKRLAKARPTPEPEYKDTSEEVEKVEEAKASDAPLPVPTSVPPPLPEKDSFEVLASASSGLQSSSLRVGRAPRPHLSRPARPARSSKFSAAFEDEEMSEESRKDIEMIEEAAKRAPVFEVSNGFRFPETKPVEQSATNAKEPPIASLPFSFATPSSPDATSTSKPVTALPPASAPGSSSLGSNGVSFAPRVAPEASLDPAPRASTPVETSDSTETAAPTKKIPDFFSRPAAPLLTPPAEITTSTNEEIVTEKKIPDFFARPAVPPTVSSETSNTGGSESAGKVPNFFGSSKILSVPTPVSAPTPVTSLFPVSSEPTPAPTPTPSSFPFGSTTTSTPVEPPTSSAQTEEKQAPKAFSFGPSKTDGSSSLFGFSKQNDVLSSAPAKPVQSVSQAEKKNDTQSFLFGQSQPSTQPSAAPFSFNKPAEPSKAPTSASSSSPLAFSGSSTSSAPAENKAPFQFSTSSSTNTNSTGSLFGGSSTVKDAPTSSTPAPFTFGQPQPATNGTTGSLFGRPTESAEAKPSSPFLFSQPRKDDQPKSSPFGAPPTSDTSQSSPFSFGNTSNNQSTASPFAFGNTSTSTSTSGSAKPFAFGGAPTARPVTPPNQEQEVRMDESPTRDPKPTESRSSLGFAFGGSSTPAPLFGQGGSTNSNTTAPVSTGFAFGLSNTSSDNTFGNNKSNAKPFGSNDGFGQASSSSSSFTFGPAKTSENDASRPGTASGFGAGSSNSSFTFGPTGSSSNPFGQNNNAGSAPNSPSTFGQTQSFTFGPSSSTTNSSNPFAFGSPAASPATPNSALPSGFGSGTGFQTPTPTTPTASFGGSTPSGGGGSLFTIGSAPAPSPGGAGNRPMKKLPTRRGGKR
ncbi:hypothetical protein K435DRAFT_959484 [Dendrothele bispora CBS 962.96]|uniref:Uncharacterized protein n=1 Tax=Dendrothele bispora (strain CBS 962.96) TaxID=1314807 RepID=A0A4S8MXC0_DENBC|nr:hypothetical protein K435DRAFT_959484 [Dendrothele bispora CBS 962.96]